MREIERVVKKKKSLEELMRGAQKWPTSCQISFTNKVANTLMIREEEGIMGDRGRREGYLKIEIDG
jgi:hypothetical protein